MNAITRAIEDKYSRRGKYKALSSHKLQSIEFRGPGVVIRLMRAECRGQITSRSVQKVVMLANTLRDKRWTVAPAIAARLICSLEECLILALNWNIDKSASMDRLRNEVYDVALLVFANTRSPERLKDDLLAVMVDLVFMFKHDKKIERSRDSILLLLGLPRKPSHFTAPVLKTQRVIRTVDLINLHTDIIHSYCSKYAPSEIQHTLRSMLACLGVFAQQESIDHFNTHTW